MKNLTDVLVDVDQRQRAARLLQSFLRLEQRPEPEAGDVLQILEVERARSVDLIGRF